MIASAETVTIDLPEYWGRLPLEYRRGYVLNRLPPRPWSVLWGDDGNDVMVKDGDGKLYLIGGINSVAARVLMFAVDEANNAP